MKQILCFGDSNTYGYIPENGQRYPWGVRWTSLLNEMHGFDEYRVLEEGLCGRTTIFEDPLRHYRNGVKILPEILETNGNIDVAVIMLGTNDCKRIYGATAEVIGKGIEKIIDIIRTYSKEIKILIVSPIHLGEKVWHKEFDPEFSKESVEVSKKLEDVYKAIASARNLFFLAASDYAKPSEVDQEHMTIEGHSQLAKAMYKKINEII